MRVEAIVKHPEAVSSARTSDEMGVFLQLYEAKEDMGVIIGKRSVTSSAIKLLTKLAGFKHDLRLSLKIEEPE
jgi:predicted RNA-binding protein YlqC (UPF0109 family)